MRIQPHFFAKHIRRIVIAGFILCLAHPASAAPLPPGIQAGLQPGPHYTVNSSLDPGDPACLDDNCSLRAAIAAANADGAASTITFILPAPAVITLGSALPAVTGALTIEGPGADKLAVSGAGLYRVLELSPAAILVLTGVTIRDGHQESAPGGGIYNNHATLKISDCTIANNYVIHGGAGISNDHGTLTINQSLISGNLAGGGDGGGVYNDGGTATIAETTFSKNDGFHDGGITNHGSMTVIHSYFSENTARIGGAIDNALDGVLTVTGSTFTLNIARFNGGAIQNQGQLAVANSTFYKNGSTIGADISNQGATVYVTNSTFSTAALPSTSSISGQAVLRNSILAAQDGIPNCAPGGGTLSADSHNLSTDASCGSATVVTSNQLRLAPFLDYGGGVPMLGLFPGSAGVDAGDDAVCAAAVGAADYGAGGLDQRGAARPQGAHCDAGAFEQLPLVYTYLPLVDE